MGTLGTTIRKFVRGLIANKNLRSSLTINAVTRTTGSDGGYNSVTETQASSRTAYAIPEQYIQDNIEMIKLGDLRTGELRLILRDDESIDTNDLVAFESKTYRIRTIEPLWFNEVIIANTLILSEELE